MSAERRPWMRYAIRPRQMAALRKRFVLQDLNSERKPESYVQRWIESGYLAPKPTRGKELVQVRITKAGRFRGMVAALERAPTFWSLSAPQRERYTNALVVDLIYTMRIEVMENLLVGWVLGRKKKPIPSFEDAPEILEDNVRHALEVISKPAKSRVERDEYMEVLARHPSISKEGVHSVREKVNSPHPLSVRAAAMQALKLWKRKSYRQAVLAKSLELWKESAPFIQKAEWVRNIDRVAQKHR